MRIDSYHRAGSAKEAYELLKRHKDSVVIGGGAWLKLMPKTIADAVDLYDAGLDCITENDREYEVGAMVTHRQLETYKPFEGYFNGILQKSTGSIMGVTVRNVATIGGTVAGRYGFSDLLPSLMALGAEIGFYESGRQPLKEFLEGSGHVDDIITHIYLKKTDGHGWFETMKNTAIDFPVLNAAVTKTKAGVNIVVGARPYKAACAEKAMGFLNGLEKPTEDDIKKTADMACEELKLGSNQRGSAEYRKELARTLITRGLREVLS